MIQLTEHRDEIPNIGNAAALFIEASTAHATRTHRAFAEQEITIPNGPYEDEQFSCDTLPYTSLWFDELDFGDWSTYYVTGPTQSGKTLVSFAVPILYTVAELSETTIMSVPEADMATDKFKQDLLPIMLSSPSLRSLIPQQGPGSKGGSIKDYIELGNGVTIKVMSRGGRDTNKAGFTSRSMALTEAAGFSQSSDTSSEADPLRQLKGRLRSFSRAERRMIVEGTVTTDGELPWRARTSDDPDVVISSESRIVCPCPHCLAWVTPERDQFVGWKGAKSDQEAADCAHFICPACEHPFTEEERTASNRENKLLHRGQEIGMNDRVVGDRPRTSNLFFRWSAWNNLLAPMCDLGMDEWEAEQSQEGTEDRDNAEKQMCQQVWCIPFEPEYDTDHLHLDMRRMRKRRAGWPENVLPPDTTHLAVGIDLGKWTSWFVALAGRANKTIHVPAYGAVTVMVRDEMEDGDVAMALMAALNELRDDVLLEGWMLADGGELRTPDRVIVDAGYSPGQKSASQIPPNVAADFCNAANEMIDGPIRYFPAYGRGASKLRKSIYRHPTKRSQAIRKIGDKAPYYLERNYDRRCTELKFDADFGKLWFQARFVIRDYDTPGALTLHQSPDVKEHSQICAHVANEQYKVDPKTRERKWFKTGHNHLLDCGAMASFGLFDAGFDLREEVEKPAERSWWGNARKRN